MQNFEGNRDVDREKFEKAKADGYDMCIYVCFGLNTEEDTKNLESDENVDSKTTEEAYDEKTSDHSSDGGSNNYQDDVDSARELIKSVVNRMGNKLEGYDITGGQMAFFCTENFHYEDLFQFVDSLMYILSDSKWIELVRVCLIPYPGMGLMVFPESLCFGNYDSLPEHLNPENYTNFATMTHTN